MQEMEILKGWVMWETGQLVDSHTREHATLGWSVMPQIWPIDMTCEQDIRHVSGSFAKADLCERPTSRQ